ncbi:hypothetical protein PR048_028964 [Dryococelus australis]|uniref:Uncharacterized protein n=1 Tax=Dryococelus australis TaxID=614101 RepID=A0ABQ9GES2_9NEOP|nr:hypothetical protein PR048_028964 [Dryococelus australis]
MFLARLRQGSVGAIKTTLTRATDRLRSYAQGAEMACSIFLPCCVYLWDFKRFNAGLYNSFACFQPVCHEIQHLEKAFFSYVAGLGNSVYNVRDVLRVLYVPRPKCVLFSYIGIMGTRVMGFCKKNADYKHTATRFHHQVGGVLNLLGTHGREAAITTSGDPHARWPRSRRSQLSPIGQLNFDPTCAVFLPRICVPQIATTPPNPPYLPVFPPLARLNCLQKSSMSCFRGFPPLPLPFARSRALFLSGIWADVNIEVMRADEGEASAGMQGWGETRDPRGNSPTSGIVRYDSHVRKSGNDPAGNRTRFVSTSSCDFTLGWHPSSSDLNPIVHLWDHLKRLVRGCPDSPQTLVQLEEALRRGVTTHSTNAYPKTGQEYAKTITTGVRRNDWSRCEMCGAPSECWCYPPTLDRPRVGRVWRGSSRDGKPPSRGINKPNSQRLKTSSRHVCSAYGSVGDNVRCSSSKASALKDATRATGADHAFPQCIYVNLHNLKSKPCRFHETYRQKSSSMLGHGDWLCAASEIGLPHL